MELTTVHHERSRVNRTSEHPRYISPGQGIPPAPEQPIGTRSGYEPTTTLANSEPLTGTPPPLRCLPLHGLGTQVGTLEEVSNGTPEAAHVPMTTDHLTHPFGGSTRAQPVMPATRDGEVDFAVIQDSAEFRELRTRLRRFVFPVSALFLGWYLTYVLLAAYARSFMSIQLFGEINVGMLLGFLQFVSTGAITIWYVRFARRKIDPVSDRIRDRVEIEVTGG